MPIQIAPRLEVTQSARDMWREFAQDFVDSVMNETNKTVRAHRIRNSAPGLLRAKAIVDNTEDLRAGMKYEIARLTRMPIKRISAEVVRNYGRSIALSGSPNFDGHPSVRCLVILTNDITITNQSDLHNQFNAGPYAIYLPEMVFRGDWNNIHFIPMRDPRTMLRLPHHRVAARNYWGEARDIELEKLTPPQYPQMTCWGHGTNGYGIVIASLANGFDVSGLIQLLLNYAQSWNPGSNLVGGGCPNITHMERIA